MLVGAKASHRPEPDLRDEAVRILSEEGLLQAFDRYWAPLPSRAADPSVVDQVRRIALAQHVDDVIRGVRVFHGRPDRSGFLAGFRAPVVVVRGADDPLVRRGEGLPTGAPNATLRRIPGAGHYVSIEAPAALTAIVAEAIGAPPGG